MCCKKYDGYQVDTYSVNPFDRVMNALKVEAVRTPTF